MTVWLVVAEFVRGDEACVFGNVGVYATKLQAEAKAERMQANGEAVRAWVEPWVVQGGGAA